MQCVCMCEWYYLCNTATQVAPASRSRVCDSHNVEVKHDGCPQLRQDKGSASETDEEAQQRNGNVGVCCGEEEARYATGDQQDGVSDANAQTVTDGANENAQDNCSGDRHHRRVLGLVASQAYQPPPGRPSLG